MAKCDKIVTAILTDQDAFFYHACNNWHLGKSQFDSKKRNIDTMDYEGTASLCQHKNSRQHGTYSWMRGKSSNQILWERHDGNILRRTKAGSQVDPWDSVFWQRNKRVETKKSTSSAWWWPCSRNCREFWRRSRCKIVAPRQDEEQKNILEESADSDISKQLDNTATTWVSQNGTYHRCSVILVESLPHKTDGDCSQVPTGIVKTL